VALDELSVSATNDVVLAARYQVDVAGVLHAVTRHLKQPFA
jgi:hypothetical protein